ncbi:MAG: tRNA lysidine(34) synthetase TilS [bacterium]|nr:tRNA lysidine(34) synthetase TilS [bacterium]
MGAPLAQVPAEVARAIQALGLVGRSVLVAVSGGVDSMVLLHALAGLREEFGLGLAVAHVHHGLRGAEADADARCVEEAAAEYGLVFRLARVEPESLRTEGPSRSRPSLQEAARRVRYDALDAIAAELGSQHIATAHQRDDQAETLLLRLFRGTGPDGLAGIPPASADGRIVRPLLGVDREAIEAWAGSEALVWREDASNRDPRFARARLRQQLRALAESLNPGWQRALADLADAQRDENEWLDALTREAAPQWLGGDGEVARFAKKGWETLPPALARRLIRLAWHRLGGGRDVSRQHLERALRFLVQSSPGARLELPGGLILQNDPAGFSLASRERSGSDGGPTGT